MNQKFEIIVAKNAGACYGVERALNLTREAIESAKGDVCTFCELIHNPIVTRQLKKCGVKQIENANDASGCVIIRSHGVDPQTKKQIEKNSDCVVDATCPFVTRAQKKAYELASEGRQVIIVGDKGHAEVKALCGYSKKGGSEPLVIEDTSQIPSNINCKVGIISQTTQNVEVFNHIVKQIKKVATEDVKVANTICSATHERQVSAEELSKKVDMMIVIGGKNSSNTTRLFEICQRNCEYSFHIENLDDESFYDNIAKLCQGEGKTIIGITGGASTPLSQLQELQSKLNSRLQELV